jgi:hypothetical protein
MKFGKVIIVGCVKNSEKFLPNVFQNLEKITDLYNESAFIFIENDSIDRTKDLLKVWGETKVNFRLLSMDGLDEFEKNRTVRLEIARNAYINAIKNDLKFNEYDHMIVIDMDDRGAYPLDAKEIYKALSYLNSEFNTAAVFANQSVKYYDLWALRHPQLCPFDFWHEVLDKALEGKEDQDAFNSVYKNIIKRIPVDSFPIQVESAFGGLGIYKLKYVLGNKSRYIGHEYKYFMGDGVGFNNFQTCEHVSFHHGISQQGGKMFILPYLINSDQDTFFNPSAFRTIMIQR